MPRLPLSPQMLNGLQSALREANFKVEQWNLRDDRPTAGDDRPQVLLVAPPEQVPPMQMRGMMIH